MSDEVKEGAPAKELTPEQRKNMEALSEKTVVDMSIAQFFKANKVLKKIGKDKHVSLKAFIRSFIFALNDNLTDIDLRLIKKEEIEIASLIGGILNNRTIMQAALVKRAAQNQEESEDGK